MLPEIWAQNLNVVFVGTTVAETSDELGFYYLGIRKPDTQSMTLNSNDSLPVYKC